MPQRGAKFPRHGLRRVKKLEAPGLVQHRKTQIELISHKVTGSYILATAPASLSFSS